MPFQGCGPTMRPVPRSERKSPRPTCGLSQPSCERTQHSHEALWRARWRCGRVRRAPQVHRARLSRDGEQSQLCQSEILGTASMDRMCSARTRSICPARSCCWKASARQGSRRAVFSTNPTPGAMWRSRTARCFSEDDPKRPEMYRSARKRPMLNGVADGHPSFEDSERHAK